jgi:anti-sigma B factor antagonist
MKISRHIRSGVAVLSLEGDFIGELDRSDLSSNVQDLLAGGNKQIVVDLRAVHHINSCGLGSLVSTLTTLRKAGGELRLASANPGVRSLFEMTQLVRVLNIHETIDQALAGFGITTRNAPPGPGSI